MDQGVALAPLYQPPVHRNRHHKRHPERYAQSDPENWLELTNAGASKLKRILELGVSGETVAYQLEMETLP
jgi:hypothetical protein